MKMDTLEFGYVLMRQRPRIEALAISLAPDRQAAGVAVRQALAITWRTRKGIGSEVELGARLYANLQQSLQA
jgi:hypothetical protein